MAAEIREILEMTRFVTKFSTGEEFDYFADEAMKMYPNLLDDEIIAEIKGIAEGSTKASVPLSFAQALAWNANIEMMWSWWPMVKGKPPGGRLLRHHHCSAFIVNLLQREVGRADTAAPRRIPSSGNSSGRSIESLT